MNDIEQMIDDCMEKATTKNGMSLTIVVDEMYKSCLTGRYDVGEAAKCLVGRCRSLLLYVIDALETYPQYEKEVKHVFEKILILL